MDDQGFNARVLVDSISPAGIRLTTLEVRFPRFVLSEFNTHRVFSRNSASSRAMPTSKIVERVLQNPAMPVEWGVNKPGMSANETLTAEQEEAAKAGWLRARDSAVEHVRDLQKHNVHKQISTASSNHSCGTP